MIGKAGADWLVARQIRPETAQRLGVYTARKNGNGWEPSAQGTTIVFPYFEGEMIVAEKYRPLADKRFWQREGGKRIFWNVEVLELAEDQTLIITEGEMDALTAIDCGFDLTVSVPDGAPSEAVDTDTDSASGKFAFMWEARSALMKIKCFVIAVDNDGPGRILQSELVRRLGPAKCKFVEYPEGCKDLNDVRMKHGEAAVRDVLNNARDYPLRGLYRLSDYPERPPLSMCSTGWSGLDEIFKPYLGGLVVLTGVPGHGKSSFAMNLIVNICNIYGWTAAVFSPEMPLVPHMRDKLRRIILKRNVSDPDHPVPQDKLDTADAWVEKHLIFLDADPTGMWDTEDKTFEWVLQTAISAVQRFGIRILLIDPWNEVEHSKRKEELMTEYIGRCIRELRRFAQQREVLVIVVAHPTKEIVKEKRPPGLYDIDGSAHWANKPDHGLCVHRTPTDPGVTDVYVNKVRFGNTGRTGALRMSYDIGSERYIDGIV